MDVYNFFIDDKHWNIFELNEKARNHLGRDWYLLQTLSDTNYITYTMNFGKAYVVITSDKTFSYEEVNGKESTFKENEGLMRKFEKMFNVKLTCIKY